MILFHVATEQGGRFLLPLALACRRSGHAFAAFFTDEGVLALRDRQLCAALGDAERAVVCEESWKRLDLGERCPVEFGSQTDNSALMGRAARVVSL
ncbi:MAG: hypothetical protein KJZ83_17605 [Burkholderiaceae bacterium]|nr:hypothetical protein [Burkholderiaceae bacterium]